MANTLCKIQVHLVFVVKFRLALIKESWEEELFKYITGIVEKRGHKMLAINGMPDHLHIFIGQRPHEALSDLAREIKKASTNFINERKLSRDKFQWQEGFAGFSYAESDVKNVVRYVLNQKEHHREKSFQKEFRKFLDEFDLECDPKYSFVDPI